MKKTFRRPVRPHPTDPTAALVELTRGYWAIVDAADAEIVGRFNWQVQFDASGGARAARTAYPKGSKGAKQKVYLHRLIGDEMGIAANLVDHKDRNGLNNRRSNLRAATKAQNNQNATRRRDNTSGIKGVSLQKQSGRWQAYIGVDRGQKFLGIYATKEEAALAVAAARPSLHGDFARSN